MHQLRELKIKTFWRRVGGDLCSSAYQTRCCPDKSGRVSCELSSDIWHSAALQPTQPLITCFSVVGADDVSSWVGNLEFRWRFQNKSDCAPWCQEKAIWRAATGPGSVRTLTDEGLLISHRMSSHSCGKNRSWCTGWESQQQRRKLRLGSQISSSILTQTLAGPVFS